MKAVAIIAPFAALSMLVLVSFGTFWLTYLTPVAAPCINWLIWLTILPAAWLGIRSPLNKDAAIASLLWFTGTIVILEWAFAPTGLIDMPSVARERWTHPLQGDNVIPLDFARGLLAGHVPSPLHADWLSSDRPPLQTSLFLALRVPALGPQTAAYQVFSSTLQMAILPVTYSMVRSFGADIRAAVVSTALVFFAPVTLINGIFVWPKLIPAAFLMAAAAIHFSPAYNKAKQSGRVGFCIGVLSAGAMLSHGGAAFTLLAFGMVALASARWATWRYSLTAIVVACVLYIPWIGYQTYIDPPGNRLIKWHLADTIDADDTRDLITTIQDAYAGMTLSEFWSRTAQKLTMSLAHPTTVYVSGDRGAVRTAMFFYLVPSMGFVGMFVVAGVVAGLASRACLICVAIVLNFSIWIVTMFNVAGVVVHTSSLFVLIAAIAVLGFLIRHHPVIMGALLGGQLLIAVQNFAL